MDVQTETLEKKKLSATDYAIITCDQNDVISGWDDCAEMTFGWSSAEACGQPLFYLLLPPSADSIPHLTLQDIISTGQGNEAEQFSITKKVQHKSGATFTAHLLIFTTNDKDSIIILARDLSRQQRFLDKISEAHYQQKILEEILKISVEPKALSLQFEQILDYLFAVPELKLLPQAAIFLAEVNGKRFTLKARRGFSDQKRLQCTANPQGMCRCGQAAQYETFSLPACSKVKSRKTCDYSQPHGHYCLPIRKGNNALGVICLYTEKNHTYHPETEQLLKSIANILAGMIENREMDLQLISLVHDLRSSINELREEKKFSESIIQGLTHGLIVTDLEGIIHSCNGVAKSIMTPFTSRLIGKNLNDIIGQRQAAKMLDTSAGNVVSAERELALVAPAGDKKIIGFSTVPREDARGRQVGCIISINDLSELKYVRKEMEKMNRLATVAEIASAVAHEVRNPLAGIKIMAQSIQGQSVSQEEQTECLTRIIRQVDRLNSLLSEFFSYARPADPQVCATSLHDIIADTQPLIANKMVKNHIIFRENYQQDIPPIYADPNQVQQVLLNLFLNAMDAIKQGGIIKIKTAHIKGRELIKHRKDHPGLLPRSSYVAVSITDNGVGMPADITEKVFEPFFTTKSTGTGLGLSIVYRTLRENNAAITVESIPNRGTTFSIYFSTEN